MTHLKVSLTLLFALYLGTLPLRAQTDNRTELHVAFITSFGGEYNSSGSIPAVQLATELINNRSDLLSDYKLVIEAIENPTVAQLYADSMCERSGSLSAFLRQVTTGEDKVALLGCGCSTATEPVAEISGFWNITHIAYASSSDTLSNQQRFPNFWRTYPQESNLASSVVAIMREYNWTVLKIITQDESIFTGSTAALLTELQTANITVNEEGTTLFQRDDNLVREEFQDMFQPEIRVYLLNMYSSHARQVLCAAAQATTNSSFYHTEYVWITLGWYREQWWTAEVAEDPEANCTDDQLEEFLSKTIGILQANAASNESATTEVLLTAEEFEEEYNQRRNISGYSFEASAYHAYDAVWSLAFAINSSLPELEESGLSLDNFEYRSTAANISKIIQAQLQNTTFVGVTGDVFFNVNGTRVGINPKIQKYRDNSVTNYCGANGSDPIERVVVATVVNNSDFVYEQCEDADTVWPPAAGGVPSDGSTEVVITGILLPIFYVYTILASAGIIFAVVCLLFNFIFRKRKIVRLISPNLNYLIITGAIFMYASVYGFVVPSTDPLTVTIACQLRGWLQTTGYFLCFGTIVAKMWRVYYIFHHPQIQKSRKNSKSRGIQDWHLLIIVALMTSVVVIILFFVAIIGDYKATEVEDNETPEERTEDKVLIEYHNLVCQGPGDTIWIIVSYAYILLTQVVGVILAFRTRKVKIKALNDAKYTAIIIYLTSVIVTVMIICAVLLRNFLNADAATFGGLLLAFTTIVLSLVFIPKMVILYRDPKGEKIFERTYSASQPTLTNVGDNELMDRMNELEKHSRNLETRLGKYETVTPFRSFSTSLNASVKLRSGSLNYMTPSSPMHTINPTLSLPVTPIKMPPVNTDRDTKMTNGTSGYLTEGDRSSSASAVERTEKEKTPEQAVRKPDQSLLPGQEHLSGAPETV